MSNDRFRARASPTSTTRQKRKLEQETSTDMTTDIAHGSAQWWYNRMSKQRMHPDLNAHLTYNPATARIELSIIVRTLKVGDEVTHKGNDMVICSVRDDGTYGISHHGRHVADGIARADLTLIEGEPKLSAASDTA
jgi:hypothetical protein